MKLILIYLFLLMPIYTNELRNIFVGDLIELKIEKSTEDINFQEAFKEFYIEYLRENKDSYNMGIRPLKTGVFNIDLNSAYLEIKVSSLINDENYNLEEYLEDKSNVQGKKKSFPYYIFTPLILLVPLYKMDLKNKIKIKGLNPEEEFLQAFEKLEENQNFIFELSFLLRTYLDRRLKTKTLFGDYSVLNEDAKGLLVELDNLKYEKKCFSYEELKVKSKSIFEDLRGEENV